MTSEIGKNRGFETGSDCSEEVVYQVGNYLDNNLELLSVSGESEERAPHEEQLYQSSKKSVATSATARQKNLKDVTLGEFMAPSLSVFENKFASNFNKLDERVCRLEGSVKSRDEKVKQVKIEIVALINKVNTNKQNEANATRSSVVSPMNNVTRLQSVEETKKQLKTKVKEYMHLLSDMGGHSLEVPNDSEVSHILQLDKALNKTKATLNNIYNLITKEPGSESWASSFYPNPKMKPFYSVERLSENPRLKHVTKDSTDDLQQMVDILSAIIDAYYAIAIHRPEQNEAGVESDDDLIQEQIMQVILGEFGKKGTKIPGMMDDIIGEESLLLGYEWHELKMLGTILKIAGYVLLALVALTTVLTIVGVTLPALLLSLAVTAQANFIVSQAINAVTTLGAMLGVNLSVGVAAATSTAVFASAVTMFGKAVQVCAGPSQLMLDKNQAASDIADAARALRTSL